MHNSIDEITVHKNIVTKILDASPSNTIKWIMLSGSRADKLIHKYSDYDIYVCLNHQVENKSTEYSFEGDCRIQVQYYLADEIEGKINTINQIMHDMVPVSRAICEIVWRVQIGIPLYGSDLFEELRGRISRRSLQIACVEAIKVDLNNKVEDFWGLFEEGDWEASFHFSKVVADLAFDLYLALHGELTDRAKFRIKKLRRSIANDDMVAGNYLSICGQGPFSGPEDEYFESLFKLICDVESKYIRFHLS